MRRLTDKQERFCQEYLVDLNATQTAIRAKYSEKTARQIGQENLSKPNIQERIAELMKDRSQRTKVTQDMVIQELALIGFSDIAELLEIEEGGLIIAKKFDEIPEGKTRVLKAIKEDRIIRETAKGDEMVIHDKIRYETWDKIRALELLGKHLNIFTEEMRNLIRVDGKLTIEVVETK